MSPESTIANDGELRLADCLPRGVADDVGRAGVLPSDARPDRIVEGLLSRDALAVPSVADYVSYLKVCLELSLAAAEMYDLMSPPGSSGKKEHLRHTGPEDVMQIANYLYVLDSHGVEGCVLECGTSHGYSTCCLSHACAWLGRVLYAADSFEGLPPAASGEPFFRPGDYASSVESVRMSVRRFGRPDAVKYVKGWFSDSLRDWSEPIALLWVDVDLYDSARDVISCVEPCLARRGGLMTHEFTDFNNRMLPRDAKRPPNAIFDVLDSRGIGWKAHHLHRYLGAIVFPESCAPHAFRLLPLLAERLKSLDSRDRTYRELRDSRTVRWAFAWKQKLLRH